MSWIDNLVNRMAEEEIKKAKNENRKCKDCGCEMAVCAEGWKDQRKCCPDCKCTKGD